jgi:hypothetical protein
MIKVEKRAERASAARPPQDPNEKRVRTFTSGGASHYWYIYNPKDLGEVAKGRAKAGLVPHSMARVTYPGNNGGAVSAILGACFDPEDKRLYLYKPFGFQLSRTEQPPLIHVYTVK